MRGRLAESVSKTDSDAKLNELETKLSGARWDVEVARKTIEDLEAQLSQSTAKIDVLQSKLSESVPSSEAEAIAEKANRLEAALTETREKLNSSEAAPTSS